MQTAQNASYGNITLGAFPFSGIDKTKSVPFKQLERHAIIP
jgi:hypothetical protein